jgi:beta-mannosidase
VAYGIIPLNGVWQLTWSEDGPEVPAAPHAPGQMWIDARVPAPIHETLMEAGLIEDPNVGLNSLRARWVEEQYWVYRTEFDLPEEALCGSQWLVFDWLELDASVRLNGHQVGRHRNAHRRARFRVDGYVRPGKNVLVVVVESGLHGVNDVPVSGYGFDPYAQMTRRPLLRKAQYQAGWDWNPRMMNVGILGGVRFEWSSVPLLDQAWAVATVADDYSRASVRACVRVVWPKDGRDAAEVRACIRETGSSGTLPVVRPENDADLSEHRIELVIECPSLWWPRGQGPQSLYTVDVALETTGGQQTRTLRTGVRKVEIDQSPHPERGRHFIIRVNDRPIFCKGGNWVPPDLMPSRVPPERYRELVRHAFDANFTMLRVWGGGIFVTDELADACDEAGILLWHDFLFACAKYPGDDPDFVTEVELEVTENVRRLARHPSLAVWCGNNEVEWGDREWGYRQHRPVAPHHALFHLYIPNVLATEDPSKAYWPSSPWSPDFGSPNDPTIGDQHPWGVSILEPGPADFWKYRGYVDRFPNEGGVLGASLPITLEDFLPEGERRLLSPSWVHHDNPIAFRGAAPGDLGRAYDTFRLWTGLDPLAMDYREYALLSGVIQAEGLVEYIANYRRRMYSSSSAIFWMYNDSWPTTHGWTIVDYYLRRKLSYHPVRRAFQPVTVVVADEGDQIAIYGVNDTPEDWSGQVRYGLFCLAGGYPLDRQIEVVLPRLASTRLAAIPLSEWERSGLARTGAFAVLSNGDTTIASSRLFRRRFHELEFVDAPIEVGRSEDLATFTCSSFAWAVCLDVGGSMEVADNCFDLLPGVRYTVPWSNESDVPRVECVASRVLLGLR